MKNKVAILVVLISVLVLSLLSLVGCKVPDNNSTDNKGDYSNSPRGLAYRIENDGNYCIITGIGTCGDKDIVIPEKIEGVTVTTIKEKAFYGCSKITSVKIPKGVVSIGFDAFFGCYKLNEISVDKRNENYCSIDGNLYTKDGKTLIQYAVGNTRHSFTIPKKVTTIEADAFFGCNYLTSVLISENIKTIGDSAFYCCFKLVEVINKSERINVERNSRENGYLGYYATFISNCNDEYQSRIEADADGYVTYSHGRDIVFIGYIGNETDLILPSNINKIQEYALYDCDEITSVVIPEVITSISSFAFANCDSLVSVEFPNSLTTICENAFQGSSSLDNIIIPETIKTIEDNAFAGCLIETATIPIKACRYINNVNLKTVIITSGYTLEDSAFRNCRRLQTVVLPETLTSIGTGAFSYCISLSNVEIPSSVRTIGYAAFKECHSLKHVVIPDGVTIIKDSVFENCESLESIIIPDSVTVIERAPFGGCYGLTSVDYKGSVEQWAAIKLTDAGISSPTFYSKQLKINGEVVTEVVLSTVKEIYYGAFINCEEIESVIIGDSVTAIWGRAFAGCTGLKSVTIGNNVTKIKSTAFEGCDNLQYNVEDGIRYLGDEDNPYRYLIKTTSKDISSATINSECKLIADSAFWKCSLSGVVIIPDLVVSIGNDAFDGCTSLTSVVIGNSVTTIGDFAFYECNSLRSVVIGNSVTFIGGSAFSRCSRLTSIKYCGNLSQWSEIVKCINWDYDTGPYTITYDYKG